MYGDPEVHPQTEDYWGHVNPIGPRSCYDEGKRVAESLCMSYHQAHNLEIRLARIFNTYGPRMDPGDGRVVSNFITQALRGDALTIFGEGKQTRSFCYVDDLVEGLMRLMNTSKDFAGPVNIGNPTEFTIKALAENIIDPSKVVSDQYESSELTLKDGGVVIGRIVVEENGKLFVMTSPLTPDDLSTVNSSDVKSRKPWHISMMPPGLINALNEGEWKDLIAYLQSGANPADKVFAK